MNLDPQQEAMLRGEQGPALAKAMETLVVYGKAFGARRLVPIRSGHLAGTFGVSQYKGYYSILDQLVAEGVQCKVPTTVNPRPGQNLNLLNRVVFSHQSRLEANLASFGIIPNYSCVCYEQANVPGQGDIVAWAESSAVQFANSVLGARTNRNSILIDVCSAVTGLTPEFGYLLDEHRRGQVLVKLNIERMDAAALGFIIGQRVVDKVPVIEHRDFSWIDLKNMGGAMAAAGAVALFHVEGLTPEAPDLRSAFDGEPPTTICISQEDLDAMRIKDPDQSDLVVFGCPQMTFEEASQLAERFTGSKIKKPTMFCLIPDAKKRFEAAGLCGKVQRAGVRVVDCCPVAALTARVGKRHVLTPSAKCLCYLAGTAYATVGDCLQACGAGS
jgi:predicted aconitase